VPPDDVIERGSGPPPPGSAPLGTAQWMSEAEALQKFAFDDSLFVQNTGGLWEGRANGQLWVGETFDGGPVPIGHRDDRHVLLVSGTRGGKGTGVIIPNLCLWPGSCIVIDPKGENATVTARRRGSGSEYAYGLGQTVRILDPFGEVQLEPALKARFNPLDAIDPKSDFAVDDAGRIAAAIVVIESQHDPFWEQAARNLVKALILHVLTSPYFEGRRNLVSVWRLLRQGDWLAVERLRAAAQEKIPSGFTLLWHGMKRNAAYNGLIAGEGEQMVDMHERTRAGILKVATTATEFIDGPPMQRLLEVSDFDLAALKTDPKGLTIYLTLPQRYMTTHYRWLRLMISLAVGDMERIKGRAATGHPTLFVLDEFAGLKRMEAVENAAAQAAGFGVKFLFVLQNLPQLKEIYDDSWETFLGNSGLRLFFQIDDNFTRNYLAQQIGEREVLRQTRSGSQSQSFSASTTEGQSSGVTDGSSDSVTDGQTTGSSSSTTEGRNRGHSYTTGRGRSGGSSFNLEDGRGGFQHGWNRSRSESFSAGWSRSRSTSNSDSRSRSRSFGFSRSRTASTSSSRSQSRSTSSSEGWNDAVHKRLLINPDEIGRFLARIDSEENRAYPGILLSLIPGQQPLPLHRVNYFQSPWFDAFFDPHPDHPPPPTLAERIRRIAELRMRAETTPTAADKSRPFWLLLLRPALIGGVLLLICFAGARWWLSSRSIDSAFEARAGKAVLDTYLTAACQMTYNTIVNVAQTAETTEICKAGFEIDNPDGSRTMSYTPTDSGSCKESGAAPDVDPNLTDLCGSYTLPAATNDTTAAGQADPSAFRTMQTKAIFAGERDVRSFISVPGAPPSPAGGPSEGTAGIDGIASAYSTEAERASEPLPITRPPRATALFENNRLEPNTISFLVGKIMARFQESLGHRVADGE
jgi:type IV secretory pathway TraG/TraD family ATPase VirD4